MEEIKVDSHNVEESYYNMPILLSRIIITLITLVIILVISIITLFPLKETKYQLLVMKSAEENFVTIKDINEELSQDKVVKHWVLENYVIARETINNIDDDARRRYKIVNAQSSKDVYQEFRNIYNSSEKLRSIDGFSRKVKILTVSDITSSVSIVEFELTDLYKKNPDPNTNKQRNVYKATLQYEFKETTLPEDEKTLNPLAINITAYELTKVRK
ncbi:MAG: type IV secretion system protein [Halarcobacter ebronensis]|uniref:type IV secretion system protein n=1 Tax=Halarcobacter ebronensis TaxID=1462615 RepID=UPI003C713C59